MKGNIYDGYYAADAAMAEALYDQRASKATATLSPSGGRLYTGCAQRYRLVKEEGLVPPMKGVAAQSGSLGHLLLARAYARAFKTGSAEDGHNGVAADVMSYLAQEASNAGQAKRARAIALGVSNVGDATEIAMTVASVVNRTLRKYLETDLQRYALIGTELPTRRLIPGVRGVAATGVLDLVLHDARANSIVVMDHKFTGEKPSKYVNGARYDSQRPSYFWTASEAYPGMNIEFVYNVIRAKVPSEPEVVDKGRRFSKSACDTTAEAYRRIVRDNPHLADDPTYLERVAALDAEDTFNARIGVTTTAAQVNNWLAESRDIIRARRASKRTGIWMKNRAECAGTFGLCPFRDVCEEDTPFTRAPFTPEGGSDQGATDGSDNDPSGSESFEAPF